MISVSITACWLRVEKGGLRKGDFSKAVYMLAVMSFSFSSGAGKVCKREGRFQVCGVVMWERREEGKGRRKEKKKRIKLKSEKSVNLTANQAGFTVSAQCHQNFQLKVVQLV